MAMPNDLVLVRHGRSAGNAAMDAAKRGDTSLFTEDYVNTPGRKWGLDGPGLIQPKVMGDWIAEQDSLGAFGPAATPRRYYCSPLTRTRHTAAIADLRNPDGSPVTWRLNRDIRERDWGDIESMTKDAYRAAYKDSAHKEKIDPLYWRPPGGESIADVASNRVLNWFDTLHRECAGSTVFAVTHGEWIRACLLAITRANDEDYWVWDEGFPTEEDEKLPAAPDLTYTSDLANLFGGRLRIPNCATFHLSRYAPDDNRAQAPSSGRVAYVRIAAPVEQPDGQWAAEVLQDWTKFDLKLFTNEDLLSF